MSQDYKDSKDSERHGNTRESHRSERSESPRSEHVRERGAATKPISPRLVDMGVRNVRASLRMQKEMFDTFEDIGRDWLARAASEAELVCNLPNRLNNARSVPDAFSTYHEWLSEWLSLCREDGRRLVSDGQKIVSSGMRCLAHASPAPVR